MALTALIRDNLLNLTHRYAPNKCKWKGKQRRPTFGTKNNIIKTKLKNKKNMRDVIAALTKPES